MRSGVTRYLAAIGLTASTAILVSGLVGHGTDGFRTAGHAAAGVAPAGFTIRLTEARDMSAYALPFAWSGTGAARAAGTLEIPPDRFGRLPKWRDVLRKVRLEATVMDRCAADEDKCGSKPLRAWRRMLHRAQQLHRMARLDTVNRFFNAWPYRADHTGSGGTDRWASPVEFMNRSGDCEDFAIAKFFTLRRLGVANGDMRIVTVFDERRGVGHAVLLVRHGGDLLVLDSLDDRIVSHRRYRHYVPRHSVNETTEFAYRDARNRIPLSVVLAALGGGRN